jgi:uncharacterized membrane protein
MGGRLRGLPAVAVYTGPFAMMPYHGKYVPLISGVLGGIMAILIVVGIIAAVLACTRCAQALQLQTCPCHHMTLQ